MLTVQERIEQFRTQAMLQQWEAGNIQTRQVVEGDNFDEEDEMSIGEQASATD